MQEIGDTEWITWLGNRLAACTVDPALELVVQQTIIGDRSVSWHVVAADGRLTVHAGVHPSPDVSLTTDAHTARAIADGERSAQREFLDGRLQIGGDIVGLIAAREVLAAIT